MGTYVHLTLKPIAKLGSDPSTMAIQNERLSTLAEFRPRAFRYECQIFWNIHVLRSIPPAPCDATSHSRLPAPSSRGSVVFELLAL